MQPVVAGRYCENIIGPGNIRMVIDEFFTPRLDMPQRSKLFREVINLTEESEGSCGEFQIIFKAQASGR